MKETLKKFGRALTKDRKRGFISGLAVGALVLSTMLFAFTGFTFAAAPSVSYASPDDGASFVDVYNGYVNYTVNVSDGDGDLQEVELWSNATSDGSWQQFYDSGALGGVSFHNTSGSNVNWSRSGELIYYNISANDGTWTNTTYSFRNEWFFGNIPRVIASDASSVKSPMALKNPDSDVYVLIYEDGGDLMVKESDVGTDWNSITPIVGDTGIRSVSADVEWYDDVLYVWYIIGDWHVGKYNTSSNTFTDIGSIGVQGRDYYRGHRTEQRGMTCCRYNGDWHYIIPNTGDANTNYKNWINRYSSDAINSTSPTLEETLYSCTDAVWEKWDYGISSTVYNGMLHSVIWWGGNYYWHTFDGNSWTDKGTIGSKSNNDEGGFSTFVHDKHNDILVFIYMTDTGLFYKTTDNTTSFSSAHEIPIPDGWTINYLHAEYFNQRINLFLDATTGDTYSAYMMTNPSYMNVENIDLTTGRIEFPDATPTETHVNSTVFRLRNIHNDTIDWIQVNWSSFGDIETANNIEVWGSLDNSSWTDIGTLDASGNLTINTTTWAAGMPLEASDMRYMKFEILDMGGAGETTHLADNTLKFRVHFQ